MTGERCPQCDAARPRLTSFTERSHRCHVCGYRWSLPEAAKTDSTPPAADVAAHPPSQGARTRTQHRLRPLVSVLLVIVVAFFAITGSGLIVRHDAAAWLPGNGPVSQTLRGWAEDLGLMSPTDVNGAIQTAAPGPRPIIFIPGIMGSILTDASGNETWPALGQVGGCIEAGVPILGTAISVIGGASGQMACDSNLLRADAFSSDGTPSTSVDVANGVQHSDSQSGGLMSTEYFGGVIGFKEDPVHFYDITLENAKQAGYTVVQSDSAAGLSVCNGVLRCVVPIGVD